MDATASSAAELDAAFATGATTPRAVAEALLARIARLNPTLNAIVTLDPEAVLAQATAATARRASGRALSPLDGVPVTVKDNLFVGGMRATWGSLLFEDFVAPCDDIAVERLRAAGAVILGKTNTPELAMASVTDNRVFGRTRNPWDLALTPGGSSGGAAAQLAARLGPLALATDAGGSTRRPASFCGVVGLKPSIGAVPRAHGFPPLALDFQVIGAMARTVEDTRSLFGVIAGPDHRDPASFAPARAAAGPRGGSAKVLLMTRMAGHPVDPDCVAAARKAAAALAAAGHVVEEIDWLWDADEIERLFSSMVRVGVARVVARAPRARDLLTPPIAALAEAGTTVAACDYVQALDRVAELRLWARERLAGVTAVVTPTGASLAWPAELQAPPTIDGIAVPPSAGRIFATAINLLGLPAVSVPAHQTAAGLPVGAQIFGPFGADLALLDLAAVVEEATGLRDRVPPFAV